MELKPCPFCGSENVRCEKSREATPGRALSFESLGLQQTVGCYEPVRVADQKRLYRLLELSNKMAQSYRASVEVQEAKPITLSRYDDVYVRAMAGFDEEDSNDTE